MHFGSEGSMQASQGSKSSSNPAWEKEGIQQGIQVYVIHAHESTWIP